MALPPTTPGGPGETRAELIRRMINRPASPRAPSTGAVIEQAPARPAETRAPAAPQPGFRLRTATTDAEIEAQIARLRTLIANDNIDPNAPAGSYLNILL
jgi:hypothetical protein